MSSAGDQVCDGPARLGAPVVADFYGRRKLPGTVVDGPWNKVLSDTAGEPVRLVRAGDPSASHDEYPGRPGQWPGTTARSARLGSG